jgi:hypothetical protein
VLRVQKVQLAPRVHQDQQPIPVPLDPQGLAELMVFWEERVQPAQPDFEEFRELMDLL